MSAESITRLIERQAAASGERTAILTGRETVSYRQLNQRANAVARALVRSGFRRGGHAVVCMPRSGDLAIVLLAVLKAGGSYTWFDPASAPDGYPPGLSIGGGRHGREDQFLSLDVSRLLADHAQPNPNLPIVTRGSDIACVLPDTDGAPAVLVPHATITSLMKVPARHVGRWAGEVGALDLWVGLMSGATVSVDDRADIAA